MWYVQIKDLEDGSAAVWRDLISFIERNQARHFMCQKLADRGEEDLTMFRIREEDNRFDGMVNGEY